MWPIPPKLAVTVVFLAGWLVNGLRWQAKWDAREVQYQATLLTEVNAAVAKLQKQLDDNQIIARKYEQEIETANTALAAARADARKLRVCAPRSTQVPATSATGRGADESTTATGLPQGDSGGTETLLDPQFLYEIGGQANVLASQVRGLQRYVNQVCLR